MKPIAPYALVPAALDGAPTHALVHLTPERIEYWLKYSDLAADLLDGDNSLHEIVLIDETPVWHTADQLENRGSSEDACERLFVLADNTYDESAPRLLHPDLFSGRPLSAGQWYDMDFGRIAIDERSVKWKAHLRHTDEERETAILYTEHLYRALALALPDEKLPPLLKRMVDTYPALALDMIEYGVAVESAHDEIRRPIVVPTAALSPYLNHHERDIRERAIRLLGRTPARAMRR